VRLARGAVDVFEQSAYCLTRSNDVSTVKQDIEALIQRLPEDCTIEDVQYHLYILEKIRRGVESAEAGRVKTQEEVEERFSQWFTE
jgi:predicted transcriptional regulator